MSGGTAVAAKGVAPRLRRGRGGERLEHPALSPFQQAGAAWIVRTCRRHGGALLYDAPGLGKTRMALLAAQALGGVIEVIAPAAVLGRWREELDGLGMSASLVSDGLLSRATARPCVADVVVVDEAHRFATVGTARERALAGRVVGRTVVLLTATPARNAPEEALWLIELFAPLPALVGPGRCEVATQVERALGQVGLGRSRAQALAWDARVGGPGARLRLPRVQSGTLRGLGWSEEELDWIGQIAGSLVPLRGEPRALYRQLVWRALSSSPQAAAGTLRRGCGFARRWEEARVAGGSLSRAEHRALLRGEGEQLVFGFWYREGGGGVGFDAGAVREAEALAAELMVRPCAHAETLRALVGLSGAAVLFAERRETVDAYAGALGGQRLVVRVHGGGAWAPGAGRCGVEEAVDWFVAAARSGRQPVLVSTPVLSEGLDLQCAAAVVHLDVAWNPARMEQREGRVVRPGGAPCAQLLRVAVDVGLERRCGAEALLLRKGTLPSGERRGGAAVGWLTLRGGRRFAWRVTTGAPAGWVLRWAGGGVTVLEQAGAVPRARPSGGRRGRRSVWWLRCAVGRRRVRPGEPRGAAAAAMREVCDVASRLAAAGAPERAAALVRDAARGLGGALPRGLARQREVLCGGVRPGPGAPEALWRAWLAELPVAPVRGRGRLVMAVRVRPPR